MGVGGSPIVAIVAFNFADLHHVGRTKGCESIARSRQKSIVVGKALGHSKLKYIFNFGDYPMLNGFDG